MEVKVETAKSPNAVEVPILVPVGDIDMHESPKLRSVMLAEIAKKPKALIVDLASVHFIDSSGVATFIEGMKGMNQLKAPLILCSMSEKIRDVFELARLDKFFTIKASRAEAVASLSGV